MIRYRILFGKEKLTFNINDNQYTKRWVNLVKDNLNHPNVKLYDPVIRRFSGDKDEVYFNQWNKLKQSVDLVNRSGLFDKLLPDPTVSNLNQLHYDFHKKCDQWSDGRSEGTNNILLNKLNTDIHSCEHLEKNIKNGPSVQFKFALTSGQLSKIKLPLEDIIEYCNKSRTNRDLTVGYHEIGKCVWDAYNTNDVDLLKNNDVVPFRNVSTSINFSMIKTRPDEWRTNISERLNDVHNWLQENDLDKYNVEGDNIIVERPVLGSLDQQYTFDDVYDITKEEITSCGFG